MIQLLEQDLLKSLIKYVTARVDIKNVGDENNTIKIISNSDPELEIYHENWFKDNYGEGLIVESTKTKLNLKIQCINDGELDIKLKTKDVKDKNNVRFPIFIDFTKFYINDIPLINNHTTISHDAPFVFKKKVNNLEEIDIYLEWFPFNDSCEFISSALNVNQFSKLEKEFTNFKNETNKYLDSYNFLFNKLFLDFKQQPTGIMEDLKSVCLELLSFVGNVCKKYDLSWWLDYGNLIGAIRHENFIPWDDDVDIGMMREDYNELNRVIQNEIKNYGLDDLITIVYRKREIDGETIGSFLQLLIYHETENGKRLLLAGVDVFPYDYLINYENKNALDNQFLKTTTNYYKNLSKKKSYEDSLKQYYQELNCTFEKTNLIIPGVEGAAGPQNQYPLFIVDSDKLFPLTLKKYADKMFPCPHDYDYYLKLIYGDYMHIPKSIYHHSRVERFRYIKNTHEYFFNYIDILKDANNKFIEI